MLNNVCLQGNLGAAPELNTSTSGISSVSFRIAVKRNYKETDGNYKTDWFSCVAFRHTAEFICNHFGKGDMIIVNGSLRTGEYTDKAGNKVNKTEIYVEGANFGGSKASSVPSGAKEQQSAAEPSPMANSNTPYDDYPF